MTLHFSIPNFLRIPRAEPLPYVVMEPYRDRKGRFKPGISPALNRKRASVQAQLAVYCAVTSLSRRKADTKAWWIKQAVERGV